MTYLVNSRKDMVDLVKLSIADLQSSQSEMMILPMRVQSWLEALELLLLDVLQYDPGRESDHLHSEADGIFRMGAVRTVDDALDQIESLRMARVAEFVAVRLCMVEKHNPGKTRRLQTPAGIVIVDLKKYADVTGLPLYCAERLDYSVFLFAVPDKQGSGWRIVLVSIKGKIGTANGGNDSALAPLVALLQARAGEPFSTAQSFYTRDLRDGWQLLNNELFREALGWFRGGAYYLVNIDENRGGLNIAY